MDLIDDFMGFHGISWNSMVVLSREKLGFQL